MQSEHRSHPVGQYLGMVANGHQPIPADLKNLPMADGRVGDEGRRAIREALPAIVEARREGRYADARRLASDLAGEVVPAQIEAGARVQEPVTWDPIEEDPRALVARMERGGSGVGRDARASRPTRPSLVHAEGEHPAELAGQLSRHGDPKRHGDPERLRPPATKEGGR